MAHEAPHTGNTTPGSSTAPAHPLRGRVLVRETCAPDPFMAQHARERKACGVAHALLARASWAGSLRLQRPSLRYSVPSPVALEKTQLFAQPIPQRSQPRRAFRLGR